MLCSRSMLVKNLFVVLLKLCDSGSVFLVMSVYDWLCVVSVVVIL